MNPYNVQVNLKKEQVLNGFDQFLNEMSNKHDIKKEQVRRIILRREMSRFSELIEYAAQL